MKKLKLLCGILLISISVNAQFQQCNSPTTNDLWDVYFINPEIGVAVGDLGTIIRSTDGGLNWNLVMSNDTVNFRKVNFFDELNGLAIGSDIYRTNDGGLNWINQNKPNYYLDLEILNNTTCIVSAGFPAIIKSSDQGLNWDTLVVQNTGSTFGLLSFVDENIGYSCQYGGTGTTNKIQKTIDGGLNWTLITTQTGHDISVIEAFDFISEDIGFRAGWYSPHFMKTSDTGDNWAQINYLDGSIQGQMNDLHIKNSHPAAYYACGWYGTIIKSTDGGNNWDLLDSGVSSIISLYGIFFMDASIGWVVGAQGTILKTTNGGVIVGTKELNNSLQIKVYPNPTDGRIWIENKAEYEIKSMKIFDVNGALLTNFDPTETIDISNWAKGIYFIEIETDQGLYKEKIIKS